MRLTQKQESLISRYLRDVTMQLDTQVSERVRERGLSKIKARIDQELGALRKDPIEDTDVEAMLECLGPPADQARVMVSKRTPSDRLALSVENRIWLGVCAGIAARTGLDSWVVRLLAVLFGLAAGPLAILGYLALYLTMYWASGNDAPRIRKRRVLGRVVGAFLVTITLHLGALYGIRLIYFAHVQYIKRPVPPLGQWEWLEVQAPDFLFWGLAIFLPLAALSAMPLANAWDYSLKRVVQAGLALYGVLLSFGIASVLVGIILDFVHEFTG